MIDLEALHRRIRRNEEANERSERIWNLLFCGFRVIENDDVPPGTLLIVNGERKVVGAVTGLGSTPPTKA